MNKDNFKIIFGEPRKRVIDAIYFDLKITRNEIVNLEVDLKYNQMFDQDEEALSRLEELYDKEDYLLMKLAEEKKLFRPSDN